MGGAAPGVEVRTRIEAAAFMGVTLGTFGVWEHDGRVTIPRYRAVAGSGRTIFYAGADLERLPQKFRKLEEPYPDPERPGVCHVPIQSAKQRMEAIIDAEDLPKVEGNRWNWHRRSGSKQLEVVLATVTERAVPRISSRPG